MFRWKDKLVLWTQDKVNKFLELDYEYFVYVKVDLDSKKLVSKLDLTHNLKKKKDLEFKKELYFEIKVPKLGEFEKFVSLLEHVSKHKVEVYLGDVKPENFFLYKKDLKVFDFINEEHVSYGKATPDLEVMKLEVVSETPHNFDCDIKVKKMFVNDSLFEGEEEIVLRKFAFEFEKKDPDVLLFFEGYSKLPYLVERLKVYGLNARFNRFGENPKFKGSNSFFSYGKVVFRVFSLKLKGRILIDTATSIGRHGFESVIELSRTSNGLIQDTASKSPGAIFSQSVVKEMIKSDVLVPHKDKPIEDPVSLKTFLKGDRTGFVFDPKIGLHENVAEIDFSSMFPWLIYNYNLSAETFKDDYKFQCIPKLPFKVSLSKKGFTPRAIKPFLDERMLAKQQGRKDVSDILKGVLVSSYGYLRFREFKLGTPVSYMSICSLAREIILDASLMAEKKGFEVVHGVVDSLYIHKKVICEREVKSLCLDIYLKTGIPMDFEVFDWIVFLPSINNFKRPVPTKYYAKGKDYKIRGLELRTSTSPLIVKNFQLEVIKKLDELKHKDFFYDVTHILKSYLNKSWSVEELTIKLVIGKEHYKNMVVQRKILTNLKKKGVSISPGQKISFIYDVKGPVLVEDFQTPNKTKYKELLIRSLVNIIGVFGYSKKKIQLELKRQTFSQG